jgi:hypothetical protein
LIDLPISERPPGVEHWLLILHRLAWRRIPGSLLQDHAAGAISRHGLVVARGRTWVGARAQSVLMPVWRTCWQQGRSALDFLSQLLRGTPVALALPP